MKKVTTGEKTYCPFQYFNFVWCDQRGCHINQIIKLITWETNDNKDDLELYKIALSSEVLMKKMGETI